MFSLKNLSSPAITAGTLPWDFKPESPIPAQVHKDKKLRDQWINAPATAHNVYSFFEGVNANLRISKPRSDGGGNPVHAAHALVADYDSPQPVEKVLEYAKTMPYQPNWIERTLSGNWRFVWGLDEPLLFPSDGFARHFLKKFAEYAFDPSKGCPGFDKKAWEAPERLWTNGCDWTFLQAGTIPQAVATGWLVKAGASFKFTEKEFGPVIPLDVVKEELVKKYPKFNTWGDEFTLNSQGPTFWVDASTSPKSAIVRETGIQTFSANATKGFYTWADLLGIDFVRSYEAELIGHAVEGIYFDGRAYWRRITDESWNAFAKEDMILHFRASRGLTTKPGSDGISLVDRALEHIQNNQQIVGAAPFIFQPPGVLVRHGFKFLNTSTRRVLQPAEGVETFGPGGNFPWVSQLFEIFVDDISRNTVLAWLAWGYRHAYRLEPVSGQVLFIAGPVGVGKTLLNRAVFGGIFGGFAEAGPFLMGEDNFNSELFGFGFWALDDGSPSVNVAKMRHFSFMLKRITANGEFRSNEKFKKAVLNEWLGRLCITCNSDEESISLLPETGVSNQDKLILVRTKDKKVCEFPARKEIQEILARELPYFCKWLLDWEIPVCYIGESRFGIKAYADPKLLESSHQSRPSDAFRQIFEDWRQNHFTLREPDAKFWEGTAHQLYTALLLDPQTEIVMRAYPHHLMEKRLITLKADGLLTTPRSEGLNRIWRTERPQPCLDVPTGPSNLRQ